MNAYEMKNLVDQYMSQRGWSEKKSYFSPYDLIYNVTTTDYTELNTKVIKCKNGKSKIAFKVDGKVTSIYK